MVIYGLLFFSLTLSSTIAYASPAFNLLEIVVSPRVVSIFREAIKNLRFI